MNSWLVIMLYQYAKFKNCSSFFGQDFKGASPPPWLREYPNNPALLQLIQYNLNVVYFTPPPPPPATPKSPFCIEIIDVNWRWSCRWHLNNAEKANTNYRYLKGATSSPTKMLIDQFTTLWILFKRTLLSKWPKIKLAICLPDIA